MKCNKEWSGVYSNKTHVRTYTRLQRQSPTRTVNEVASTWTYPSQRRQYKKAGLRCCREQKQASKETKKTISAILAAPDIIDQSTNVSHLSKFACSC